MATDDQDANRHPRLRAVRRDEEQDTKVRFLELFFDLVFVLGFTQCTALMVEHSSWAGLAKGLLVLTLLWWSWSGYAWLTSVIDPEEDLARIVMFGAMAALLVVALAVPQAFEDQGLAFAIAYGVVRLAHLALFVLASQEDPELRHSVATLTVSTAIGISLLVGASFLDGTAQASLWIIAIAIDYGGPAIFGVGGWRLVPAHFAERFGLIIILSLGESIVALGVGAEVGMSAEILTAAVFGVALASALWWTYFDVVAIITEKRLAAAPRGPKRNALARDSYSYLHLPMAAGIVLVAVGLEATLHHVSDPLEQIPAYALLGGVSLYLLAHVGLRLRNAHTVNWQRLIIAIVLVAGAPLATEITSLATLILLNVILWAMIAVETRMYGTGRDQLRHS